MLYEQVHYTQISFCPNMQFLSTQQHMLIIHFQVTSGLDFICIAVARWVNFRQKYEHELQLSDRLTFLDFHGLFFKFLLHVLLTEF